MKEEFNLEKFIYEFSNLIVYKLKKYRLNIDEFINGNNPKNKKLHNDIIIFLLNSFKNAYECHKLSPIDLVEYLARNNEISIGYASYYNQYEKEKDKLPIHLIISSEQALSFAKIFKKISSLKHLKSIEETLSVSHNLGFNADKKIQRKNLITLENAFGSNYISNDLLYNELCN